MRLRGAPNLCFFDMLGPALDGECRRGMSRAFSLLLGADNAETEAEAETKVLCARLEKGCARPFRSGTCI